MTDLKLEDARELYPDADDATLALIGKAADNIAATAEMDGQQDGVAFSAAQSEYGCDWAWGDGTTIRDETGRIVPDEDATPTARVFDCDGNTIQLVTREWLRETGGQILADFRASEGRA